jgi:hypothetical protein
MCQFQGVFLEIFTCRAALPNIARCAWFSVRTQILPLPRPYPRPLGCALNIFASLDANNNHKFRCVGRQPLRCAHEHHHGLLPPWGPRSRTKNHWITQHTELSYFSYQYRLFAWTSCLFWVFMFSAYFPGFLLPAPMYIHLFYQDSNRTQNNLTKLNFTTEQLC